MDRLVAQLNVYCDDFWQTPVITEKIIRLNLEKDPILIDGPVENTKFAYYLAFPWATYIDVIQQHANENAQNHLLSVVTQLQSNPTDNEYAFTVCQHIYFKKVLPIMKRIGIKHLFTPHATLREKEINGIQIHPLPLYPVHAPPPAADKPVLYSFVGSYNPTVYLTNIRKRIYEMKHPPLTIVHDTGEWHFEREVYHQQIRGRKLTHQELNGLNDRKTAYENILANSRYSLCPSGSGPNSIRFWESLSAGAIPVLLSDDLRLSELYDWDNSIIRIPESDLGKLENILSEISVKRENELRENCLKMFNMMAGLNGSRMHVSIGRTFQHLNRPNIRNERGEPIRNRIEILDDDEESNIASITNNVTSMSILEKSLNSLKDVVIISYCCDRYPRNYGGVPRFDYQLSTLLPQRVWFGPSNTQQLLEFVEKNLDLKKKVVVITDNHLAMDIPNHIPTVIMHHGSAQEHARVDPIFAANYKDMIQKQSDMWDYRDPKTTKVISMSEWCHHLFEKFNTTRYTSFEREVIPAYSELPNEIYKNDIVKDEDTNYRPLILGNWSDFNKGQQTVQRLAGAMPDFRFVRLSIPPDTNPENHNMAKAKTYSMADMYLCLSLSEGFPYSVADAFQTNLLVVTTDIGFVPFSGLKEEDKVCKTFPIEKRDDITYLASLIRGMWKERQQYFGKSREWFLKNFNKDKWSENYSQSVAKFVDGVYSSKNELLYDTRNNNESTQQQKMSMTRNLPSASPQDMMMSSLPSNTISPRQAVPPGQLDTTIPPTVKQTAKTSNVKRRMMTNDEIDMLVPPTEVKKAAPVSTPAPTAAPTAASVKASPKQSPTPVPQSTFQPPKANDTLIGVQPLKKSEAAEQPKVPGDINLIVQYYNDENEERQSEIDFCVQANLANENIIKLHNLKEPNTTVPEWLSKHPKYVEVPLDSRLTFKSALDYANASLPGQVVAISNLDIFLDPNSNWGTANNLFDISIVLSLSRHEFDGRSARKDPNLQKIAYANAQDTWIFKAPIFVKSCDFRLGMMGADNAFAHRLNASGYIPVNSPNQYKVFHYDVCRGKTGANSVEKHPVNEERPEDEGCYLLPDIDEVKSVDALMDRMGLGVLHKYRAVCDIMSKYIRISNKK